jgi:hypothetical protein
MAGDASYASVALLLHGSGANNSTVFTDTSNVPKTMTAVGNAKISTAQSKFGGSSMLFDGSGDAVTTPDAANLRFGAGTFTYEAHVRFVSLPTAGNGMTFMQKGVVASSNFECSFTISNTAGTYNLKLFSSTSGSGVTTTSTSSAWAPSLNTWYHVAVVRDGTTIRFFVDGVAFGTATDSTTFFGGAGVQSIGASPTAVSTLDGYLDEARITKGVARYTGAFTPPASAYLDYAGQISGVVLDAAAALVARTVRAYDRTTGALTNSTTSSAVDGTYSMNFLTLDEMSVLCLDDAGGSLENDIVARVIPA